MIFELLKKDLIQHWLIKLLRMLSLLNLCNTHTDYSNRKLEEMKL